MPLKPIQIKFSPQSSYFAAVVEFTEKYLDVASVNHRTRSQFVSTLSGLLNFLEKHNSDVYDPNCVLSCSQSEDVVHLEVLSQGKPIFSEYLTSDILCYFKCPALDFKTDERFDLEPVVRPPSFGLTFENMGREGQRFIFTVNLPLRQQSLSLYGDSAHSPIIVEDFVIRELIPGEDEKVTDLFYKVYEYNYINDWMYHPQEIRRMIRDGEFVSVVAATPEGKLIGHIGIRIWNQSPQVIEMGTGGTDPKVKAKGAYAKIFDHCLEIVRKKMDPEYLFFDCVTNHDFSQRQIIKSGGIDTALFVGCQSKKTQAGLARLGIGSDAHEMDRYSILYVIMNGRHNPFGNEVVLPSHLGDQLGFLLEPLGIHWVPASRADYLPKIGSFESFVNQMQNSVTFELENPGLDCVREIIAQWQHYLRDGLEYAAVDIPLHSRGLGYVQEILSTNGFFVSGFFPWRNSCKLALRMQSLAPKRVAFDHIKVYSPQAKRLLELVRSDFERNTVL
jgi:hypothetical protein